MAIVFNGVTYQGKDEGVTRIGDDNIGATGIGSLTVDGGSVLDLTDANLATDLLQALWVGDGAGAEGGFDVSGSFDPVTVTGTIKTETAFTGLADAGYSITAEAVELIKP